MKCHNLSIFLIILIFIHNISNSFSFSKKSLLKKTKQFFPKEKKNIITIYYEPLNPDTIVFFNRSFKNFFKNKDDFINSDLVKEVKLIPGGMMKYHSNSDFKKYSLACQRGLNECEANKFHICALTLFDDKKSSDFIFCYFKHILKRDFAYNNVETCKTCAVLSRIDFKKLDDCVNLITVDETAGEFYLVKMIEERNKLKQPILSVPWVLVNDYNEDVRQKEFMKDMLDEMCKYFEYHSSLAVCQLIK